MEGPAFIKRDFDAEYIAKIPQPDKWVQFSSPPFAVTNSSFSDLPTRRFLSPFGKPDEEFTILIPIEMDTHAINYIENNPGIVPGIYLFYIGENWEIFLNEHLFLSQTHLDENGQITPNCK
jgi:hypothetical protein